MSEKVGRLGREFLFFCFFFVLIISLGTVPSFDGETRKKKS